MASCVDLNRELVPGFKPRKVSTPFFPEFVPSKPTEMPAEWDPTLANDGDKPADVGQLQPIAAQILMKSLDAARVARLGLLRAVSFLASHVAEWSPLCDRKLERLVCYSGSSLSLTQVAWCNGHISTLSVHLYADADFAGCLEASFKKHFWRVYGDPRTDRFISLGWFLKKTKHRILQYARS